MKISEEELNKRLESSKNLVNINSRLNDETREKYKKEMQSVISDPTFKGVYCIENMYDAVMKTDGAIYERIIEEQLILQFKTVLLDRDNGVFQHPKFDKKTQQLIDSGIVEYFAKEYIDKINKNRYKNQTSDPQKLTLKTLEAGFVVWLISVQFAVLAFLCEWIKRLSEYFIFKHIFHAFFEMKLSMSKPFSHLLIPLLKSVEIEISENHAPTVKNNNFDDLMGALVEIEEIFDKENVLKAAKISSKRINKRDFYLMNI
jgi:hypothetical protein